MGYDVRPAAAADLPLLAVIEDEADQLFTSVFGDVDWGESADGADRASEPGFLLVAGDPALAFAHVVYLEVAAHLDQIAVHPSVMGQGIGTTLLEAACADARAAGYAELALTTFADVPWNAPFYAARGFTEVRDPAPYQQQIRAHEQAMGLDRHGPRVVMTRPLGPVGAPLAATS